MQTHVFAGVFVFNCFEYTLRSGILCDILILCLIFWETAKLFSSLNFKDSIQHKKLSFRHYNPESQYLWIASRFLESTHYLINYICSFELNKLIERHPYIKYDYIIVFTGMLGTSEKKVTDDSGH